jgi:hypothetical protein
MIVRNKTGNNKRINTRAYNHESNRFWHKFKHPECQHGQHEQQPGVLNIRLSNWKSPKQTGQFPHGPPNIKLRSAQMHKSIFTYGVDETADCYSRSNKAQYYHVVGKRSRKESTKVKLTCQVGGH